MYGVYPIAYAVKRDCKKIVNHVVSGVFHIIHMVIHMGETRWITWGYTKIVDIKTCQA